MGTLLFLRADVLSLLFEALLFGCFSVLYPISLWILVYRHRRNGPRRRYTWHGIWLSSIVTVMFLLAMTHLILSGLDYVMMFADHSTIADGAFLFYFSGGEDGSVNTNMLLVAAVSLVGDCFMTYRVFIMWGRSWKAIFLPSSLILGTLGSVCVIQLEFDATGLRLGEALNVDRVYTPMTTYLSLVLATNVVTVALIIGRLMLHERMVRLHLADEVHAPSIRRTVVRTIIQSEALYSITIGAGLASYVARSEVFFAVSSTIPPLVGISFTLIITHIGFDDIKRQMSKANDADASRLNFQRAVDSSGDDSLGLLNS